MIKAEPSDASRFSEDVGLNKGAAGLSEVPNGSAISKPEYPGKRADFLESEQLLSELDSMRRECGELITKIYEKNIFLEESEKIQVQRITEGIEKDYSSFSADIVKDLYKWTQDAITYLQRIIKYSELPEDSDEEEKEEPKPGTEEYFEAPWSKISSRAENLSNDTQEFISRYVMPYSQLEALKSAGGANIWERYLLGWNKGKIERGLNKMLINAEKEKGRLEKLSERYNQAKNAHERLAKAAEEMSIRTLTEKQQARLDRIKNQITEMLPVLCRLSGELEAQRILVNQFGESITAAADSAGMATQKEAGAKYKNEDLDMLNPGEAFNQRTEDLAESIWTSAAPEARTSLAKSKSIFDRLFNWLVSLETQRTSNTAKK